VAARSGSSEQAVPQGARPTAADARRLALRTYLQGRRLDMRGMAAELGVNRATLYRWVGSRDELLVDVLWVLSDHSLQVARKQATGTGSERVVRLVVAFLEQVVDNHGMKVFLRDESDLALRLLSRADHGFQPRLVEAIRAELEQEVAAGTLVLDVDVSEAAFVVVRIIGTYTYLDLLTGETPDASRAEPILRMLLR
jgi:AcrR family transcriptional regulator